MTSKHYLIETDMVESALSDTSTLPLQNKVVKAELEKKLNKQYETTDAGKVLKIGSDGIAVPMATDFQFHFEVFNILPSASETYKGTIALIAIAPAQTGTNIYEEYVCVPSSATPVTWKWEKLGQMDFTLTQTATAITVNGTALQTSTDAQIGLMSSADHTDMQRKANKVTTIAASSSASDDRYPTEKAARTELDKRVEFSPVSTSTKVTLGYNANGLFYDDSAL